MYSLRDVVLVGSISFLSHALSAGWPEARSSIKRQRLTNCVWQVFDSPSLSMKCCGKIHSWRVHQRSDEGIRNGTVYIWAWLFNSCSDMLSNIPPKYHKVGCVSRYKREVFSVLWIFCSTRQNVTYIWDLFVFFAWRWIVTIMMTKEEKSDVIWSADTSRTVL